MGKELCIACGKELGFMKHKPKKEWNMAEGNTYGDCYKSLEKQKSSDNSDSDSLSSQKMADLKKEFAEATAMIDGERPVNEIKADAKQERKDRDSTLRTRTEQYKLRWEKNGIIQFKNERIPILKRQWGAQVEFIIAFDDLTNEGYELKAIDEGKTQEGAFGQSGGVSSYYYFQRSMGQV